MLYNYIIMIDIYYLDYIIILMKNIKEIIKSSYNNQ